MQTTISRSDPRFDDREVLSTLSVAAGCPPLFIYIPTYNRPEALRRQLTCISAQRADWPGAMRILVSDNASTLVTDEDLASIASEFGVQVRRNPSNIGANANIALGFACAQAHEHLWILSDNDTIGPTGLSLVATQGIRQHADAIIFSTAADSPYDFTHQFADAWTGIHENGLISNVIYKASAFLPHASEAFFYHNTSFPHLGVLLSALRARETLSYRVLPSSEMFAPATQHGEQPGDYRLSHTGMPQLLPLLPPQQARVFAVMWLRDQGREFFRQRESFPSIYLASVACIRQYGGFKARTILSALATRHTLLGRFDSSAKSLGRRFLPDRLKKCIRERGK